MRNASKWNNKWRKRAAQLSGAALGFIHNNIRGAVSGYKMAGYAHDFLYQKNTNLSMAPINKRKATGPPNVRHAHHQSKKRSQKERFKKIFKPTSKWVKKPRVVKKASVRKSLKQSLVGISQHNDWMELNGGHIRMLTSKRPIKTKAKFQYQEGKEGLGSGGDGQQLVFNMPGMATRAQLIGSTAASRTGSIDQWEVDPFQLNPWSTAPTNAIYPGPMGAVVADDKLALLSCHHKVQFINMSSNPIEVYIYYLTPKVDTATDPQAEWGAALVAESLTQAGATGDNTLAFNTATGGASNNSKYGLDPNKSPGFRKMWRTLKVHKLVFQGGDRQTYTHTLHWNKVFLKQTLTVRASSYYKNVTVYPMVIVRAGLVGVRAGAALATEVTYGGTKLGYVTENTWNFGALPVNRFNTLRTYTPNLVGASLVAGQTDNVVNDIDTIAAQVFI
nr:MAG: capsid protein [Cressdnaviricota sp.]